MGERIDRAALQRLLDAIGGEQEDLDELIDDFLTTTPAHVMSMRSASAEGDWSAMRISVHTLKSNAREFGATTLAELCQVLEQQCQDGAVVDPDAQTARIETELAAAREALATMKS